jgi:hypothetical protein
MRKAIIKTAGVSTRRNFTLASADMARLVDLQEAVGVQAGNRISQAMVVSMGLAALERDLAEGRVRLHPDLKASDRG